MKKTGLLAFAIFVSVTVFANINYFPATIYLHDNTSKTGLASSFDYMNGKIIYYKETGSSEVEKIESLSIDTIIYKLDNEELRFMYMKVYKGLKQTKIANTPIWLQVIKTGYCSLFLCRVSVSSGSAGNYSSGQFNDYYVIRKGEAAAKLIATIASMNNNQIFRAKAPLYFADYPALANKIRDKVYTWENLEEVIDIYNSWAEENK